MLQTNRGATAKLETLVELPPSLKRACRAFDMVQCMKEISCVIVVQYVVITLRLVVDLGLTIAAAV